MEIKTSLQQLIGLFARSSQLSKLEPVRALAAKLTILTAHSQRIEAKIDAETAARQALATELDKHLADLASIIELIQSSGQPSTAASAPASARPMESDEGGDDEDEGKAMADKVLEETAAEAAALAKASAPEVVVVSRKNGGKKSQNAGDAA
jgi:hypothetical protein